MLRRTAGFRRCRHLVQLAAIAPSRPCCETVWTEHLAFSKMARRRPPVVLNPESTSMIVVSGSAKLGGALWAASISD